MWVHVFVCMHVCIVACLSCACICVCDYVGVCLWFVRVLMRDLLDFAAALCTQGAFNSDSSQISTSKHCITAIPKR